jgi:drug/metabolite transporter (DMT)-like permease
MNFDVMTPGTGFALGAMLCFGISDLIYKRAAAAGSPSRQFIMLQAWVFCPGVTLYAWLTGTLHPTSAALWGAGAGLFSMAAFYNFARSLQDGAVSTNAPIFRLNFIITAALAILLLSEPLTPAKSAALLCALVAVWLLAERGSGRTRSTASSLTRVAVATTLFGIANLLTKIGLQHGALPETMVSAQAWVFSSLATLFAFLPGRTFPVTGRTWRYSTPAAIVLVAAFVLLAHGLEVGPASVLVPIAQMSFVFTALAGAALFHEPLNVRKAAGLLVAAAALALFAMSSL